MTPRFQLTPDGEESSDNQNALYDSLSMMRHPTTPTTLLLFEITQLQVQKKKIGFLKLDTLIACCDSG